MRNAESKGIEQMTEDRFTPNAEMASGGYSTLVEHPNL
jgi:hypothetical protein